MEMNFENKWIRGAIPALLIHVIIGSVYCWSLLKNEIAAEMGVPTSQIEWSFSMAVFFLGMAAAFGSSFTEKNVKYSALISCVCFVIGLSLTTLAMHMQSVPLLLLGYGVVFGISLGMGYITPIKTILIWFKERKGLACGLSITGFGLSKVLLSPYIVWCNANYGIYTTLWSISLVGMFCILLASFLIRKPLDWVETSTPFSIKDAWHIIKNPTYIKIWIVFFLNITCGLALLAFEKDLCLQNGITAVALISSLTAFFNTAGRFGYSSLSDYTSKKELIYKVVFASSFLVCGLFVFGAFGAVASTVILLFVINAGYGGGFSTLPTLLQSKFGMERISTIHGMALSAWAWAGLCGNQLSNLIINVIGWGYRELVIIIGVLYFVSLCITCTITNKKDANYGKY